MTRGKGRQVPWNVMMREAAQIEEDSREIRKEEEEENGDELRNKLERGDPAVITMHEDQIKEILFVHNSEHACIQLIPTQLNGNNFMSWNKSIKRALGARRKLEFIDGTFPEPAMNSPYYKPWLKVDHLVHCWITNSIAKEFVNAFIHIDTSKKLWESLCQRFGRSNGPKLYKLERELKCYTQGNQFVLMYFNNLTALWDEIEMILPPLECVCGAVYVANKREEDRRLIQFLMGLNDHFENARSQIMMLDPLPHVNKAYSMILQVEDQKSITESFGEVHHSVAMNIGSQYQHRGNAQKGASGNWNRSGGFKAQLTKEEKQKLRCNYCEEPGHEEADCFKLHGYPDWYKRLKAAKGKGKVNYVDTSFDMDTEEESSDTTKKSHIHNGDSP